METCGTSQNVISGSVKYSSEYFEKIENHRYSIEPFIHSWAQFTRHKGKKILEVGVGAGTDHLQWARAGAKCHGVDLTKAGIVTTKKHLEAHNLSSDLKQIDAEKLPFNDNSFDVVYSWGVIHHSKHPDRIISEIHRVLKKNGIFIGMMYGRRSLVVIKYWIKYALLSGKPWRSPKDVIWNHMESIGIQGIYNF